MATLFIVFLLVNVSWCMNPTVYWYTNTNLENNQRIVAASPTSFTGFYFCCGQFQFLADGTFTFKNSTGLMQNIEYFRKSMDFIYIVGDVQNSSTFSASSSYLQTQFEIAAKIAKEINIDGFLVDYEPDSSNKQLASNYAGFLGKFEQIASKYNIGVGCDIAGWGILDDFSDYAASNLNVYTSMTPTYYGTNIPENENYVMEELKYLGANTLRTGIGSMLTKYPSSDTWYYNWTQSRLTDFLDFLKYNVSVPSVDIWRADIDHNGYDTEPWFYQCLEQFVKV